jgi:molecular chaperone Hsp33
MDEHDDDIDMILMGANDNVTDDIILPFSLQESHLRGRIVRLGTVLDDILLPHSYPMPVAQLVGEAATLTLLLGGMLKYDGVFTLQAQGDGPVRLVVADLTSNGHIRGMASFNPDQMKSLMGQGGDVVGLRATDTLLDLKTLMGSGHLAFTVDQQGVHDRYQGIVELNAVDLATSVYHYFQQSEQIETILKVGCGFKNGAYRAGGIMIQRLPVPADALPSDIDEAQDHWNRARAFIDTCTRDELIRETLPATTLLYRLFHEDGVKVFNPISLTKGCRCSPEKLSGILDQMSDDDRAHMTENGKITMHCEFCSKDFKFEPKR